MNKTITLVKEFFDQRTSTLTYVVYDENTRDAVVIDPVLDYDPEAGKVSFSSTREVIDFLQSLKLTPHFVLETHVHADHLSGSQVLKQSFPNLKIAIGRGIHAVQATFKEVFGFGSDFQSDGSQFELLLEDGQTVSAGSLNIKTLFTPGHTPACVSYLIGENLFVGDAIFMPDYGTGRCDFPGGDSAQLYDSIQRRIYALPGETVIYVGHDYQPNGRPLKFKASVAEQAESNIHLTKNTTRDEFVQFRSARDKGLSVPKLLFPSIQVNICAGKLPEADSQGRRFLKIPLSM